MIAIQCGLREGELLGLKWDDVVLEAGTLWVRRTLSDTRTGYIFEAPKNDKGRSIKLAQDAVEALKDHVQRQLLEIEKGGGNYQDRGLIFPSRIGTP